MKKGISSFIIWRIYLLLN